jgi:phosphatidylserine decarboxylase
MSIRITTPLLSLLSSFVGWASRIEKPRFAVLAAIRIFIFLSGANAKEAEKNVEDYLSVSDFFSRKFRNGVRVLSDSEIISPCDALLRDVGEASREILVKGQSYLISELLGESNLNSLEEYIYFNFYLSPRDYHGFHAPFDCLLKEKRVINGAFWPVNDLGFKIVPKLFLENERMVLILENKQVASYLVAVAALNVGRIKIETVDIHLNKGERLGAFELGSSIVLLVNKKILSSEQIESFKKSYKTAIQIKMGEALI